MESVPYVLRDRYTFFLFSYPNREKMKQYILLIALLLPVVLHAQSLSGISSHEVVPEHPRLLLTKGEETLYFVASMPGRKTPFFIDKK